MSDQDLLRHAGEFSKAMRGNKFEISPNGVLLSEAKIFVRGLYSHRRRTKDGAEQWIDDPNLLPTEGINALLDNMNAASGLAAYISLYSGNVSPQSTWTASNYTIQSTEITSGSEGYSEGTRQLWSAAAASSGSKDNYASPAVFSIVTAGTLFVNGIGLHTNSGKGNPAGKLFSATRFSAERSFSNTDEFDVKYRLTITST